MYFKLKEKVGSHAETNEDGTITVYTAAEGHIFDTEMNLVKMFPNKFEEVHVVPKVPPKTKTSPKGKGKGKGKGKSASKKLGRNVTKQFPKAVEDDFLVFADGDKFFVTESDTPSTPLHDEPLKKDQVDPFIDKFVGE